MFRSAMVRWFFGFAAGGLAVVHFSDWSSSSDSSGRSESPGLIAPATQEHAEPLVRQPQAADPTNRVFAERPVHFQDANPPASKPTPPEKPPLITTVEKSSGADATTTVSAGDAGYRSNRQTVKILGTLNGNAVNANLNSYSIAIVHQAKDEILATIAPPENDWKKLASATWSADVTLPYDRGTHQIVAAWITGGIRQPDSNAVTIQVKTAGARIVAVEPRNFAATPNAYAVTLSFDTPIQPSVETAINTSGQKIIALRPRDAARTPAALIDTSPAMLSEDKKSLTLQFKPFGPDDYLLTIDRSKIDDVFGNRLEGSNEFELFKPVGDAVTGPSPGIPGPTGPYVPFPEYTPPRPPTNGFNPSDHVETRVSRLYFYRDAHRVAQIVNRDAKSYNRAAVDMQRQLADKQRQMADQATDARQSKERKAVEAARKTREAENELQRFEANAASAANQAVQANSQAIQAQQQSLPQTEIDRRQSIAQQMENTAAQIRNRVEDARDRVQQLRNEEANLAEDWQQAIAVEDRAREEQFRREVAAAHADPDTYVAGVTDSIDPVQQVSVSVIGEGLIQLRGPLKGVNVIRTMINQIDAPIGQVRIGVHTAQINGEKGDRMEVVANKIQTSIDHSRFLTMQSAEMLRKAITQVAAMKAAEVSIQPGLTQEERDRKYLYAFFGEDFIRELEVMDSEFLMTGNKLLSLHSMDSTSLASGLFIMALAKNSTRMQILQTFDGMMAGELPATEQAYFEAGMACDSTGKKKRCSNRHEEDAFCLLAENARFQSIRGFFNAEIASDDTMTPLQREFVRLAQIFKSRLIVEIELKQRVMERAVIEDRLGDRDKELRDAKKREDDANAELAQTGKTVNQAQKAVLVAATGIQAEAHLVSSETRTANDKARETISEINRLIQSMIDDQLAVFSKTDALEYLRASDDPNQRELADFMQRFPQGKAEAFIAPLAKGETYPGRLRNLSNSVQDAINKARGGRFDPDEAFDVPMIIDGSPIKLHIGHAKENNAVTLAEGDMDVLIRLFERHAQAADGIMKMLERFNYDRVHQEKRDSAKQLLDVVLKNRKLESEILNNLVNSVHMFRLLADVTEHVNVEAQSLVRDVGLVVRALSETAPNIADAFGLWLSVEHRAEKFVNSAIWGNKLADVAAANTAFRSLMEKNLDYQFALRQAEGARRPLDHKKFLDMLVDEMEDKYIELLEGTRAHTANIDAYIKRLITALDDDFNTQFYYPAFRQVRSASQMWDVTLGQVETTTILANNRSFAKVSPSATMEFDLPKRDIVIAEAMNAAKATMDDIGALAQDPTYLAMAKLHSGQPTSSPAIGASGGLSTVRNVLPGLSTDTSEAVLGQHGPGRSEFGSALESLIPDPAIYKFETGTGFEIRPVIQPDGQAVVFDFNYMYTTNVREPVRADEKHLGRVKRHFIDTDVQLGNFELREVSRYTVALKASRTARGVPLLEDAPVIGVLFRPLPSAESSLQQNIIMAQATIFPTLFDLMGLRWAPAVADLDPLRLVNDEYIVRNRRRVLMNRVFDHSSSEVDRFLRIPDGERRMDLYRSQESIPHVHPNGYQGPGAGLRDSQLQEGFDPTNTAPSQFVPGASPEGSPLMRKRDVGIPRSQSPQSIPQDPSHEPHPAATDENGIEVIPPGRVQGAWRQNRNATPNIVMPVQYVEPGTPRYQPARVAPAPQSPGARSTGEMRRLPPVNLRPPVGTPRPIPRS